MPKPADDRLARLLESPHLAGIVPKLAPEALHQLIRHRGLEGCGPIVTNATPGQLATLFDLDLWQAPAAGRDDRFDAGRFGAWIEALLDEGEDVAARVVAAMDRDLAILGLSHHVRVFDRAALSQAGDGDDLNADDRVDADSDGGEERTVGGYVVRTRTAEASEAIVELLMALSVSNPRCFHDLMRGCRRLSNSVPELDGLDALLLAPEQQLHDVSIGRERRRSRSGHLSAADARAFLQLARQSTRAAAGASANAIAAAYFRDLDEVEHEPGSRTHGPTGADAPDGGATAAAAANPEAAETERALTGLLAELDGVTPPRRALPAVAEADETGASLLHSLMQRLAGVDAAAAFARSRELAFLANALAAGSSVQGRPFSTREAADAAAAVCNLGLGTLAGSGTGATPDTVCGLPDTWLADRDLVTAFETGWRLLHRDVSLFVAARLAAVLQTLRSADAEVQRDLALLGRELSRQREAGTPWMARDALETIAILDPPTWACLDGLLSECPVLPDAVTALVGRSAKSVSPTAFRWFATPAQIAQVHEFAGRLTSLLTGLDAD